MWGIISTWDFSFNGALAARDTFCSGGSALDALLKLGTTVEDDPTADSVGLGGRPTIEGIVELDAAIMDGATLDIGAVAGVQGFGNPILIANDVRKSTQHNLLVGKGAEKFALEHGYERRELLTKQSRELWEQQIAAQDTQPSGHDTVGIVAIDANNVWAGTSTSGMSFKLPGRVGDSPLPGSGFYADDTVGGAAATGMGEEIMRGALCYHAVEFMREGMHPQQAAIAAIKAVHALIRTHRKRSGSACLAEDMLKVANMAIVCMNNRGEYGGAANHDAFTYAVATQVQDARVIKVAPCVKHVADRNP